MNTAAHVLIAIIAVLHCYFMILEMLLWQTSYGLKNFGTTKQIASDSAVLAANQGLYNGFLAAGLIASLFFKNAEIALSFQVFLLGCVILAGLYGGITANKKIFFVQFLPAVIAFILLLVSQ